MGFRVVFILLFCFASTLLLARVPKSNSPTVDPAYSSALAAANRFLHAWQSQDHEAGIIMLTDSARLHASREKLQDFFSPGPDASFEIERGRRINAGEYAFPIVLFGTGKPPARARSGKIILTRSGKDDWAVDKLP